MRSLCIIFNLFFITLSLSTFSQIYVSGGLSLYNINTNRAGMSIGFGFNKAHLDVSSNFASGEGEQLNFQSNQSYLTEKISMSVINFGYYVAVIDELQILPIIGVYSKRDIAQDPIAFETWFFTNEKLGLNAGLGAQYFFGENVGVLAKVGLMERYRLAIVGRF